MKEKGQELKEKQEKEKKPNPYLNTMKEIKQREWWAGGIYKMNVFNAVIIINFNCNLDSKLAFCCYLGNYYSAGTSPLLGALI